MPFLTPIEDRTIRKTFEGSTSQMDAVVESGKDRIWTHLQTPCLLNVPAEGASEIEKWVSGQFGFLKLPGRDRLFIQAFAF